MGRTIILKHKRTKDVLHLSLNEFKLKFKKEIDDAMDAFLNHENNSGFYKSKKDESDFYFDLPYNFNMFTQTNWYIDRCE